MSGCKVKASILRMTKMRPNRIHVQKNVKFHENMHQKRKKCRKYAPNEKFLKFLPMWAMKKGE